MAEQAGTQTVPWPREDLRHELWENKGHRVTVIWECNYGVLCSTGILVEVGADFVEVRGAVPTFAERMSFSECDDLAGCELETVIPLARVCGVVEDVPPCRKAGVPYCCGAADPPAGRPAGH